VAIFVESFPSKVPLVTDGLAAVFYAAGGIVSSLPSHLHERFL